MQLKRLLFLLGIAAFVWAQYPTAIDTDATLLNANDLAQSTLQADIDADDTEFTVTAASNFSANMVVKIDNEQIKIGAWNAGTRTASSLTRGYGFPTATTPASHSATGASCSDAPWPGCVRGIIASAHQRALKDAIINIQTALGASLSNVYTPTAAIDYSGAASTRPWKVGTTLPSTCVTGQGFFKSNATAGQNIYLCTATDTWSQISTGALNSTQLGFYEADFSGDPITITNATHGLQACPALVSVALDDGTNYNYGEPWDDWSCVKSTYTVTIDFPSSTSGHYWLIRGSGALAGGLPNQLQVNVAGTIGGVGGTTVSGTTISMTGLLNLISGRLIIPHGPTKPATCTVGEKFMDDDETPAGQQEYICSATDTWSKVGDGGSGGGGGTIDAATGKGLYATRVSGIQTFNVDPSVVAMQGIDNTFRGNNQFGAGQGNLSLSAPNDTSTGTEAYKLVSKSGLNIIRSGTNASTDWSVGICTDDCGTSGTGIYVFRGYTTCAMDNATTAGNWVVRSTTASGQCHDTGIAANSGARPSPFVVGISNETAASAGNRSIEITGADFR